MAVDPRAIDALEQAIHYRIWWPSTARGDRHALRGHAEGEDTALARARPLRPPVP
jgi:hypothetical protein